MIKGDYKTISQAQKYHKERFKKGLEFVNLDEMRVLKNWLEKISAKNKVVLDLGTGTGRILRIFLDIGVKKIYALDQSEAMINMLRKIFKKEVTSGKIQTIITSSNKIQLNSNRVYLATAFHLFKHLPEPGATLKEVNRVLESGGFLIFDILNTNSLIKFRLGDCFAMSETQIRYILNQNGFTINSVVYLHPLGETAYGFFGKILGIVPLVFDKLIKISGLKVGTKILIFAQKNV